MKILLKNARLPDAKKRAQSVNILIDHETIADIYTGEKEISATEVIDMNGHFVLPGLINAHVHLFSHPDGFSVPNLRKWIDAGFTYLRDEGIHTRHDSEDAVRFRDECAKDPLLPSIRVCGRVLAGPGGFSALHPLVVGDEDQARDAVKRQQDAGVDHIKVTLEDGYNVFTTREPKLHRAVIEEICNEAHRFGLRVSGQFIQARNIKQYNHTGIDDFAHVWMLETPEEIMEDVVRQGVALVPTLTNYAEASYRIQYDLFGPAMQNLKTFLELNGTVAFGDNYIQTVEPWFNVGMPMMEIRLMLKAGMTIEQVIDAMTVGGAKVLGLSNHGKVEPGYAADLVAFSGNPYEIPQLLAHTEFVMKAGIIVKHNVPWQYSMYI